MKKIISPYNNLKRLKKPKDDFLTCYNILKKKIKLKNKNIYDIGCANGEFLDFLIKKIPQNNFYGIDSNKNFLNVGKKNNILKDVQFIRKNLFYLKKEEISDITICMGVSHSLKNFYKLLNKLIDLTKKKGLILVDGFFNKYDIDTITYFKDFSQKKIRWQNDFNQFSKKNIINFLKKKSVKFEFYDAKLKSNITKNHIKKPHHFVWTERINNKNKIVTNGTNIILRRQFLIISL